jgi:hypothetical protein
MIAADKRPRLLLARGQVEPCACDPGALPGDVGYAYPRSWEDAMSWDVFVFKAPNHVGTVDQIAKDFEPEPLGAAADVRVRLRDATRGLDLSDTAWGQLNGSTWSIDLNIGSDDPVDSIMLHVRGTGDDLISIVVGIATAVHARALDISTGEFLTGDPGQIDGWHGFQRYRNQVLDGQ